MLTRDSCTLRRQGYIAFDNIALDRRGHALVVSDSQVPLNNLYAIGVDERSVRAIGVHSAEYFGSASQVRILSCVVYLYFFF